MVIAPGETAKLPSPPDSARMRSELKIILKEHEIILKSAQSTYDRSSEDGLDHEP